MFATHFHELTELEVTMNPHVKNLHVDALVEDGELILLHQLKPGPSTRSYGIEVAEMANFPPAVIQDARKKAAELEAFDDEGTKNPLTIENGLKFLRKDLHMAYVLVVVGKSLDSKTTQEIQQFLKEFVAIPLKTYTPQQGLQACQKLKQQFLQKTKNPVVREFLTGHKQ